MWTNTTLLDHSSVTALLCSIHFKGHIHKDSDTPDNRGKLNPQGRHALVQAVVKAQLCHPMLSAMRT